MNALAKTVPQPQGGELAMTSGPSVVGVLVAIIVILVVGAIAGWLAGQDHGRPRLWILGECGPWRRRSDCWLLRFRRAGNLRFRSISNDH